MFGVFAEPPAGSNLLSHAVPRVPGCPPSELGGPWPTYQLPFWPAGWSKEHGRPLAFRPQTPVFFQLRHTLSLPVLESLLPRLASRSRFPLSLPLPLPFPFPLRSRLPSRSTPGVAPRVCEASRACFCSQSVVPFPTPCVLVATVGSRAPLVGIVEV